MLGNVGTLVSFRVGSTDAEVLEREFGEMLSRSDVMGLPNWQAYVRLLNGGDVSSPFTLRTRPPAGDPAPEMAERACRKSRERYGRPAESVEAEIRNPFSPPADPPGEPKKDDDIGDIMEELWKNNGPLP